MQRRCQFEPEQRRSIRLARKGEGDKKGTTARPFLCCLLIVSIVQNRKPLDELNNRDHREDEPRYALRNGRLPCLRRND